MDGGSYTIEWADSAESTEHQIICESRSDDIIEENIDDEEEYLVGEEIIPSEEIITISNSLDQIAAENLIYMAQDGSVAVMGDLIEEQVDQVDNADYNEQQYFECQVTEEVITGDWVQQQGEDRVEVPVDQLVGDAHNEEVTVPLPTDEYTTSRPYPCDFCSRRFRKKANLMNHMVAHKNDRPHICNLCGARYIRKQDLLNHLKVHAQMPDSDAEFIDLVLGKERLKSDVESMDHMFMSESPASDSRRKTVRQQRKTSNRSNATSTATATASKRKKVTKTTPQKKYDDDMENLMGAAQQHEAYYENQGTSTTRFAASDSSRPFICQVCGLSFAREKALTSHSLIHSDNPLECDHCNDIFWSVDQLQDHKNTHHPTEDVTSGSEYGPDKDQLSDDESDSKFGDYYCSECGMAFHRLDLLRRHARTHQQNEQSDETIVDNGENHCCNVCGSVFAEALDLLAHAEIHTRVTTFKCTLCGESFMQEQNIRHHIATLHVRELTDSTCRLCGKHCKDERTLLKHSWDHSKEKNHSCLKCGKTFFNKARLKRHMQSHRNKSVLCNICGSSFPDGRSLMNHRHSHTNVSGRKFPCRECGKTFGSRSSQQIHMRIHTGERPYGCRFCWKAFADGGTLRKHERIHTGEKPYACPVCPRAFNQRVVLREHIRSHHSGIDPSYAETTTPYYCSVCGSLYKTSTEIIQHLIEHSDQNTISKRQPTVGPRKYKRRRKLKPDELERLRREEPVAGQTAKTRKSRSDDTHTDSQDDNNSNYNERNGSIAPRIKLEQIRREKIDAAIESIDNTLNEIASDEIFASNRRIKSPTKKQSTTTATTSTASTSRSAIAEQQSLAKMIHTKKKVVPSKDGRGKGKTTITRTSNASQSSATSTASKTVQQQGKSSRSVATSSTTATTTSSGRKQTRNSIKSSTTISNGTREMDLNYGHDSDLEQSKILLELSKKSVKYSPDVVSDLEEILRSPLNRRDERTSLSQSDDCDFTNLLESPIEQQQTKPNTRASKRLSNRNLTKELHQASIETQQHKQTIANKNLRSNRTSMNLHHNISDDRLNNLNIKQEKEVSYTLIDEPEVFTCEMCSAEFSDRAQLLVHVPIHI